jgi:crossover junction endodeoxyribonuclease RuvC
MRAVRILGIDPGTVTVGFACIEVRDRGVVDTDVPPTIDSRPIAERPLASRASNLVRRGSSGGPLRLLDAGALRLGRGDDISVRLGRLGEGIDELLRRFAPHEVALEEAYCGKSVQSALRVGEARGVVLATAVRAGLPVHQYPPARIKRRVAGHGGASKEAVARMVAQSLGLRELPPGPADVTDAIAVALCRVEERRSPLGAAGG